jgi:TnpA family transposase
LNDLAWHKTNNDLIADNWDDMLRAIGALQMGTVKASELIKSLHRAGRTSTLGRAIGELGRINFVGKYHFSLPEEVRRGELRPFHNPDDPANII